MPAQQVSFRKGYWDPLLIIAQIITVQFSIYSCHSILILFSSAFFIQTGNNLLDFMFSSNPYTFSYISGWLCIVIYFISTCLFGSVVIVAVVRRAKQCLDFGCSFFFFHLVGCYQYNSHNSKVNILYPFSRDTFIWWFCSLVNLTLMVLISEYLCMRIELLPIHFGISGSDDSRNNTRHRPEEDIILDSVQISKPDSQLRN